MTNLLAREVYTPRWLRPSRKASLMLLIVATFSIIVMFSILGGGRTVGAIIFWGGMSFALTRAQLTKLTDGLYYGNEKYGGIAPEGDFQYRLVCALPTGFGGFFPGVMYFRQDRVLFVGRRTRTSDGKWIDFGPASAVTVTREDRPSKWYQFLLRGPEPFLEFRSPTRIQKFRVPMPDLALDAIRKALNEQDSSPHVQQ
jgi:hypothetical protein